MTVIYIDESGFTGDDLYNPDQRYFVIASSSIGDEEAEAILRRCFPLYQGPEFKFTNIWKRGTSRNGLRALASEIPELADRAFAFLVDKRFSLLIKMFDYLVEPAAYDFGFDWGPNPISILRGDGFPDSLGRGSGGLRHGAVLVVG